MYPTNILQLIALLICEPAKVGETLERLAEYPGPKTEALIVKQVDAVLLSRLEVVHANGDTLDFSAFVEQLHAVDEASPVKAQVLEQITLLHLALSDARQDAHEERLRAIDSLAVRIVRERVTCKMQSDLRSMGSAGNPAKLATLCAETLAALPMEASEKRKRILAKIKAVNAAAFDPEVPTRLAIPTGITQLDKYLRGGPGVGELTVLALPTNDGKSLLSGMIGRNTQWPCSPFTRDPGMTEKDHLDWRLQNVENGNPDGDAYVLIVSLEDNYASYLHRWQLDLLNATNEDLDTHERRKAFFAHHKVRADNILALRNSDDARVEVVDAEMIGDDNGEGSSLHEIVDYVKMWADTTRKRVAASGRKPPRLCFVLDYVQCVTLPTAIMAKINREQLMATVAKRFARLARQEKIAVVTTAMLNGRIGADAMTVDIRESAAIEQAAHVVLKGHSCQSIKDQLTEAVTKATADTKNEHAAGVLTKRLEFCKRAITIQIAKSRTTGGRGKFVTVSVDYENQRAMNLDSEQAALANDLNDNVVGWARKMIAPPPAKRRAPEAIQFSD